MLAVTLMGASCAPGAKCKSNADCPAQNTCDSEAGACAPLTSPTPVTLTWLEGEGPVTLFPTSLAIREGDSVTVAVNVQRPQGVTGEAVLSLENVPDGLSSAVVTLTEGQSAGQLELKAARGANTGVFNAVVRAQVGANSYKAQLPVSVSPQGSLTVSIDTPSTTSYARAVVLLKVSVKDGVPEEVSLLKNTEPLAKLSDPFHYSWPVELEPEGKVLLVARAVVKGVPAYSAPRLVVVDRTPPTLVSQSVAPGSKTQTPGAVVTFTFSEPLKPDSVTADTLVVSQAASPTVHAEVSLEAGATQVTLTPPGGSWGYGEWTAQLLSTLTDRAGNPLSAVTSTFEVPHFLPVGDAVHSGFSPASAAAPSLAVGVDEKPVVAWQEADASRDRVYVSRWSGTEWTSLGGKPVDEGTTADEHARAPSVAMNAQGEPALVFHHFWDASSVLIESSQWVDGAWTPTEAYNYFHSVNTPATLPKLFLDSQNRFVLSWLQPPDNGQDPVALLWRGSKLDDTITKVNNAIATQYAVIGAYAVSPAFSGDELFVAHSAIPPSNDKKVLVRKSNASGGWEQVGVALDAVPNPCGSHGVAIVSDENNLPIVAWLEDSAVGTLEVSLFVSRWTGSAWQSMGVPVANVAYGDSDVSLVRCPSGALFLAYVSKTGGASRTMVAEWSSSQWVSRGSFLDGDTAANTPASRPVLTCSPGNKLYLAWQEQTASGSVVFVRKANE
jgi:hypothetical protein